MNDNTGTLTPRHRLNYGWARARQAQQAVDRVLRVSPTHELQVASEQLTVALAALERAKELYEETIT